MFTTTTSSKGNKALTYPVGLITLDEVVYAGGTSADSNTTYYLNNNTAYWTMSPLNFHNSNAFVSSVNGGGKVVDSAYPFAEFGARAVVNLSFNVEITSGDGTIDNPYVVK